ncbi:MAG: nitroreductase family protein [Candidatus Limnocylindrales bacterium]
MADHDTPLEVVRPLIRTRQYREFTDEPLTEAQLEAILDAARWSGSSGNEQAWRFIAIRDTATLRRIAGAGLPQARPLLTAAAAIAIVLPDEPQRTVSRAYDDGRAAERILIAASMLGLGAGISWIMSAVRPTVRDLLGLPPDRLVRTVMALGHPTEEARRPQSAPGRARKPRVEMVFRERWPEG